MSISIIIPAKNEKNNLPQVLNELINTIENKFQYEILVIKDQDDNSTNSISYDVIEKIKIIIPKKKGYGAAINAGIQNSRNKYVCIFYADGACDPKDIERMYENIKENDCIFCSRYLKKNSSEDDTIITYIGNKIFSLLGKILFKLKISDILYTYFLCDKKTIKELNLKSNDFRLCVEIPIKLELLGYSYIDMPAFERKRISGKKNVNELKDGFLILTEMIKLFLKN